MRGEKPSSSEQLCVPKYDQSQSRQLAPIHIQRILMHGDRYRNRRGLTGSFLGHTTIMPRGVRSIRLEISQVEDWMVSPLDSFLCVGGVNVTSLCLIRPSTFNFRTLMKQHASLAPGFDIAGLLLRMVKRESTSWFPSVSAF